MLIVWLCGCVDGHGMNKQQFDKFSKNESLYNIDSYMFFLFSFSNNV